jgi:putative membrane protein
LFIAWNKELKQGQVPTIAPQAVTRARMCMMLELTAILGILLCAPFMARGIG